MEGGDQLSLIGLMGSLIARSMAAMALNPPRVVDVAALVAPPIIGPGHVVLPARLAALGPGEGVGFGFVASLATITEVKVQKGTLDTVPFSMMFLTLPPHSISISRPGPRSLPLLLISLLHGLPVGVQHHRLQETQLRFHDSRYPLHDIYLRPLKAVGRGRIKTLRDGILGLRRIGIVMHRLSHIIMRQGIERRNGGIHDHGVL